MDYQYKHIRGTGRPLLVDLPVPGTGFDRIRVLEPAHANRRALLRMIVERRYPRPFIGEDAAGRSLYLSLDYVQSRMRIEDPWALELRYTRKLMSFLLFEPEPRDILLLGLGGGSLVKFCHRNLPGARMNAVEIDADVIALREYFCVPAPSARFAITQADAAEYVARSSARYDVIIADAFGIGGIATSLVAGDFYARARTRLRAGGLLVANFAGPEAESVEHLSMLSKAFEGQVLLVPVEGEGNAIAVAFDGGTPRAGWSSVRARAAGLQRSFGLEFPRFAGRLERSHKLGYLKRSLSAPRPA